MEVTHNTENQYYDIIPEKYASFSERRMLEFMFDFCNQIGLEGKKIVSVEQLKYIHLSYRIYY